jgi:hypothetical protein
MCCIGHDFEITAVKMDRFVPRDDKKTAIHSTSLRAQRGNLVSVTTMSAATRQSDGQGFRYNIFIAELLELLAGRFINSAKAFARLRVFRVGNADKPLKI